MRKFCLLALVAASSTMMAENHQSGFVKSDSENRWHFRIGPVMAPRVRVKASGPRYVPSSVPPTGTSSGMGEAIPADPAAGFADREYIDGYVKPDEGTSDPDSMVSGLTWNWGADDVGSQYSDGKMEFRTGMARWSESVSSVESGGGSNRDADRDILLGVEAMGGWTFFDDETFDAAIDGGFRFYGSGDLNANTKYGTSVTMIRNEYRYVDSYDASGWTDQPLGSYDGSEEGPGRLVGATPSRREELMGSSTSSEVYYNYASTKFNYRIWDLRLGPTFGWKATDYLTVRGGVYGLLGLVDTKLKTSARTEQGTSGAKSSACDPVFGIAAGLSVQLNITDDIYLVGGAEYDWWTDDISIKAGGAKANMELSDFTVSLALGIEF